MRLILCLLAVLALAFPVAGAAHGKKVGLERKHCIAAGGPWVRQARFCEFPPPDIDGPNPCAPGGKYYPCPEEVGYLR
jgi:hypothetical protein